MTTNMQKKILKKLNVISKNIKHFRKVDINLFSRMTSIFRNSEFTPNPDNQCAGEGRKVQSEVQVR